MADENKEHKPYRLSGKELAQTSVVIRTLIRTIKNKLDRRDKIRDPMARNMLLLDQMCVSMDLIASIAETLPKEVGFDRDLCLEIKDVSDKMKQAVDSLFDWIQHPTYTDQHPVGQEMMRQGQKSLDSAGVRPLDEN